jgi:hypothetical protein
MDEEFSNIEVSFEGVPILKEEVHCALFFLYALELRKKWFKGFKNVASQTKNLKNLQDFIQKLKNKEEEEKKEEEMIYTIKFENGIFIVYEKEEMLLKPSGELKDFFQDLEDLGDFCAKDAIKAFSYK